MWECRSPRIWTPLLGQALRSSVATALLAVVLATLVSTMASSVSTASTSESESGRAHDLGELGTLEEYAHPDEKETHLPAFQSMDGYFEFKERLLERARFTYTIEAAPILQWGAGEFHADHELNLIGLWNPIENESQSGSLFAWFQHSLTLGDLTTSMFMDSLGVLSPVNGGDTGEVKSGHRLQLLAWEHLLGEERWRIMLGKITSRVTFNLNQFAVSDREDFFSPMIVNNPVAQFTARAGLGLFGQLRGEHAYGSAMIRDADATEDYIDFESVKSGRWEYLAEGALTPSIEGLGAGNYRVTYHFSDPVDLGTFSQSRTWSLSVSADQEIGSSTGALVRYAYADTPLRAFRSRLAAGVQFLAPFGYEDDRIGVAAWWGDPASSTLRDEWAIESFWRLQMARVVELSPDIQVIFRPALAPERDVRTIVGLRARIVL